MLMLMSVYIYKFLTVTVLRYLPALSAFAFLPSPMHPVMAHYNGLNMKTDNKISFIPFPPAGQLFQQQWQT